MLERIGKIEEKANCSEQLLQCSMPPPPQKKEPTILAGRHVSCLIRVIGHIVDFPA